MYVEAVIAADTHRVYALPEAAVLNLPEARKVRQRRTFIEAQSLLRSRIHLNSEVLNWRSALNPPEAGSSARGSEVTKP